MLVAACGQNTTEPVSSLADTTVPDPIQEITGTDTTQVPTVPVSTPETTVTSATDSTSETDTSTKSVDSAECPVGQHSHDEEACNPDETLGDTPTEAADTLGRS